MKRLTKKALLEKKKQLEETKDMYYRYYSQEMAKLELINELLEEEEEDD